MENVHRLPDSVESVDIVQSVSVDNVRQTGQCSLNNDFFSILCTKLQLMLLKGIHSQRLSFISEERGWRD